MGVMDPRDEDVQRTILRAQDRDIDAETLLRWCAGRLVRSIWRTVHWQWEDYGIAWKVGDFNFLILESTVAPGLIVYAQIWSEPMESVLVEVSSGAWNPGARPTTDQAGRARLKALGFKVGGEARNFRKEVTVASPADAEVLAAEMLRIFADVFGFTGRTPLTVRLVRGERATRAVVHESLTPADMGKLLTSLGCSVAHEASGRHPFLFAERRGLTFGVRCDAPEPGSNLYRVFDFFFQAGRLTEPRRAQLRTTASRHRLLRSVVDDEGDLALEASLTTSGGVTAEAIAAFVDGWDEGVRQVVRALARGISKRGRTGRPGNKKRVVH
jgi:hypothetical protein